MSTSYLMTMPILIYNLGCEMIYVLCSRLKAQQIPSEKSCQVIHDVVIALFDKKFMFEIRKSQELAKHSAIRQLFDKLVHTSIMRLNTSSMNKLFDLMLMSVKLQFIKIKFPEEIFQITINHMNSLVSILQEFNHKIMDDVIEEVKENIAYINKTYIGLNPYEYLIMRQTLYRFFQGKNVKVSIFIQDGTQSNSGVIFLNMNETAPPGVKAPGRVIKFNTEGNVEKEYFLNLSLSRVFNASKLTERVNIITTELGSNIYRGERNKNDSTNTVKNNFDDIYKFDPKQENSITTREENLNYSNAYSVENNNLDNYRQTSPSYLEDVSKRKENIENVKKEFGQLAEMLNVNSKLIDNNQIFKLDLFKINSNKIKNNIEDNSDDVDNDYIEIEREKDEKLDKLKGMFDELDLMSSSNNDDLLDLMDIAANK